ncbi:MAG: Ku protein, partial [Rhizobacter sp.]
TEIPFTQLEKPYYLEPIQKGEKVYALLREAMLEAGVVGIARVVMHTKEYLAALIPSGPALMLNTLRWASEIRDIEDLKLPAAGKSAANLKDSELKMAAQLVADMTDTWKADRYEDHFAEAVHALIAQRVQAGKTEKVTPLEEAGPATSTNVVDLTALLKQSLGGRRGAAANEPAAKAAKPAAKKAAAKKTTAARKRA